MCGIAGIVSRAIAEQQRDALQRMTDALTHRGPDGQGHHIFERCALGHRRLAIVDLVSGGQPMCSTDGRLAITFNGEIYGYQDLRRQLADYLFCTKSDTEVILALYQSYGAWALEKLPGMFAFAIWDEANHQLFCARDRFGEKPFYYAIGRDGEFVFASEIKAILASGLVEPVISQEAVVRYLQRQCVRVDQSIYANIYALPPAHSLTFSNEHVTIKRYWSLPEIENDLELGEAVEQFRALLGKAVSRQLVADVPVGAFLSGGLDSSTICFVASEFVGDLRTFSFDFAGDQSEVEFAREVASRYHTRHTELAVEDVNIAEHLLVMQRVYDEPFGDTSAIPTYLLAREARRHVKVVLTGDGGDELFGGYTWYKTLLWMAREGRVSFLHWVTARILNQLYRLGRMPGAAARELRIIGLALGRYYPSIFAAHRGQLSFFARCELERLGLLDGSHNGVCEDSPEFGSLEDAIRLDVGDYMPADILTKIDRAAMAHGLELRAPFLDVEFASFCLSLPYRLKISTEEDKIILRRAFSAQWPASVRTRGKQGFGAPLARWFQDSAIRELEQRVLLDASAPIYDMISYRGAREVLRRNHSMQRWTLLVLAVWLAYIKSSAGQRVSAPANAVGIGV